MTDSIHTSGLDVGYGDTVVVESVDIEGLRGQIICLMGPNGAGKSTILRTLSGLLAPVSGTVYIGKDDIRKMDRPTRAKELAVVLTERLSPGLTTVYEIVSMGRYPYTNFWGKLSPQDHAIIRESLKNVGAESLADRNYDSLSDGEKQKVMIARALAQQPQLIILDEPTSHLDIKHKIEVISILNSLCRSRQITVILALHDIDLAIKSCQTVILVKDGRILASGRPEAVVGEDTIQTLYEIQGAVYDSLLGSMEICNTQEARVLVTGGNGTGCEVYRALSRIGIGLCCGILHENDVDYRIARDLGLSTIGEAAFSRISQERLAMAQDRLRAMSCAVDTAFPIGEINRPNLDLLRGAADAGITVFSLRTAGEIRRLYGEAPTVIPVGSVSELTDQISKWKDTYRESGQLGGQHE